MDTIVLDDGIEYAIVKELEINGTLYTLFANISNPSDICYRKTIIQDNEEYYIGLDDDNEFDLVAMNFAKDMLK